MKIIKKIGIMFISIITYVQSFFYKVYAESHVESLYGVSEPPKTIDSIMEVLDKLKILIIPLILLIGFITYNKKSKSDKYKDIVKFAIFIMSIIIFLLLILILAGIIKEYRIF